MRKKSFLSPYRQFHFAHILFELDIATMTFQHAVHFILTTFKGQLFLIYVDTIISSLNSSSQYVSRLCQKPSQVLETSTLVPLKKCNFNSDILKYSENGNWPGNMNLKGSFSVAEISLEKQGPSLRLDHTFSFARLPHGSYWTSLVLSTGITKRFAKPSCNHLKPFLVDVISRWWRY